MAQTSTYLNFERQSEGAFTFYKAVFGTEFANGIMRHSDVPKAEGQPEMSDEDKQLVINVQLPILGGHLLMGTDAPESMSFTLTQGNNVHICLHPDTRAEADSLYAALSEGGNAEMPLQDMFWGDYFGALIDKFGVQAFSGWLTAQTRRSASCNAAHRVAPSAVIRPLRAQLNSDRSTVHGPPWRARDGGRLAPAGLALVASLVEL